MTSCSVFSWLELSTHLAERFEEIAQVIEPSVGDRHSALVGVDCAKRKILSSGLTLGEDVEEGGLANVRQSDDAHFEIRAHPADYLRLRRLFALLWRHLRRPGWEKNRDLQGTLD